VAAALLVVLPTAACTSGPTGPGHADGPVRILLVGDSVTQGSAGDWTWRYRLWQHLVDAGGGVDFVGPRDDLLDNVTGEQGSHAYADPDFDQDHAARWGMGFSDQDQPIGDLVDAYRPDVVVELLGINDLVWMHATASQVEEGARRFVQDAQAADAGVDVVIGALPQTWVPGVDEYDAALPALAAELTTDTSDVVVASAPRPFVQGVDTYDSAHPTATGEVAIAASVADALAGLGIGAAYPRPLPEVPNGPRQPAQLVAVAEDGASSLVWDSPPGATAEYVWVRDVTTGQPWSRLPNAVAGESWTAGGLVAGHVFEFRLQSVKGSVSAEDLYSNVVTVTLPPAPAPVTPP
jgi:lysophospholipase L1-like esterase